MREFLSRKDLTIFNPWGIMENRILEPSSGGMGIRLKNAKSMFIKTTTLAM